MNMVILGIVMFSVSVVIIIVWKRWKRKEVHKSRFSRPTNMKEDTKLHNMNIFSCVSLVFTLVMGLCIIINGIISISTSNGLIMEYEEQYVILSQTVPADEGEDYMLRWKKTELNVWLEESKADYNTHKGWSFFPERILTLEFIPL